MKELYEHITKIFKTTYFSDPIVISSPGRVNLIGEHTDYNNGFVLPAAIDKQIVLAMAPNNLNRVRLIAIDMKPSKFEANLNDKIGKSGIHWTNYILGVLDQLQKHGKKPGGFDCVFGGDIPIGAGLSSSAALEGGIIFGLNRMFKLGIPKIEKVKLAQRAENEFVGVNCGIMDQFANLYGKKGEVILLDCQSLNYNLYPAKQKDLRILLFDTKIRRELATSEYNKRRQQCEEGVEIIRKTNPLIQSLRDVNNKLLSENRQRMSEVVFQRCKYVIEENQRVLDACYDLEKRDAVSFGKRMYDSHAGLRDLYEVSCKELDVLVDATKDMDAVLGARMMGGGFGGCTINIVKKNRIKEVIESVSKTFEMKTGCQLTTYVVKIAQGTSIISSDTFEFAD